MILVTSDDSQGRFVTVYLNVNGADIAYYSLPPNARAVISAVIPTGAIYKIHGLGTTIWYEFY